MGYVDLGLAVVKQAAMDYYKAICEKDKSAIMELEKFFNGDDILMYASVDGPMLASKIRRECEEYNYDLKKIKEVHKEKKKELGIEEDEL